LPKKKKKFAKPNFNKPKFVKKNELDQAWRSISVILSNSGGGAGWIKFKASSGKS
jgi:hypothetical protein